MVLSPDPWLNVSCKYIFPNHGAPLVPGGLTFGEGGLFNLTSSLLEGGSCYPQGFVKEMTQADPSKARAAVPQTNVREEGDDRLRDQWGPSVTLSGTIWAARSWAWLGAGCGWQRGEQGFYHDRLWAWSSSTSEPETLMNSLGFFSQITLNPAWVNETNFKQLLPIRTLYG